MSSKEIATHECGHLVAMMASGIYGEFASMLLTPTMYMGEPVGGLVIRNSLALNKISTKLSENYSSLNKASFPDLIAFFVGEGLEICLPQICYFYGGGAIDRLMGCEDVGRNRIDERELEQSVFLALLIVAEKGWTEEQLDWFNEQCAWLKTQVYEFLTSVFTREMPVITGIVDVISMLVKVDRDLIDELLAKLVDKGVEGLKDRCAEDYRHLYLNVRKWYAAFLKRKFSQQCQDPEGTECFDFEMHDDFCVVSGYHDGNPQFIKVPGSYGGVPVKGIKNTWLECKERELVRKVELPSSMEKISWHTFLGFTAMESISLPSQLKGIGGEAFEGCSSLREVLLPEGLEFLGYGAFSECRGLRTMVIPAGMKWISSLAFVNCSSLERVRFAQGTTAIRKGAGGAYDSLSEVERPEGPDLYVEPDAFAQCPALREIIVPKGCLVDFDFPEGVKVTEQD